MRGREKFVIDEFRFFESLSEIMTVPTSVRVNLVMDGNVTFSYRRPRLYSLVNSFKPILIVIGYYSKSVVN